MSKDSTDRYPIQIPFEVLKEEKMIEASIGAAKAAIMTFCRIAKIEYEEEKSSVGISNSGKLGNLLGAVLLPQEGQGNQGNESEPKTVMSYAKVLDGIGTAFNSSVPEEEKPGGALAENKTKAAKDRQASEEKKKVQPGKKHLDKLPPIHLQKGGKFKKGKEIPRSPRGEEEKDKQGAMLDEMGHGKQITTEGNLSIDRGPIDFQSDPPAQVVKDEHPKSSFMKKAEASLLVQDQNNLVESSEVLPSNQEHFSSEIPNKPNMEDPLAEDLPINPGTLEDKHNDTMNPKPENNFEVEMVGPGDERAPVRGNVQQILEHHNPIEEEEPVVSDRDDNDDEEDEEPEADVTAQEQPVQNQDENVHGTQGLPPVISGPSASNPNEGSSKPLDGISKPVQTDSASKTKAGQANQSKGRPSF